MSQKNIFNQMLSFCIGSFLTVVTTSAISAFTGPQRGHGFEYGLHGFLFGITIGSILIFFNAVGYLLAVLMSKGILNYSSRHTHGLAFLNGIICIFGIRIVVFIGNQITCTSDTFWYALYTIGVIITTFAIATIIFQTILRVNYFKRYRT